MTTQTRLLGALLAAGLAVSLPVAGGAQVPPPGKQAPAKAAPARAAEIMSKEILAVQVRKQGFVCSSPKSATQDKKRSKPSDASWILVCDNARYRVRLVPKMASKVQEME